MTMKKMDDKQTDHVVKVHCYPFQMSLSKEGNEHNRDHGHDHGRALILQFCHSRNPTPFSDQYRHLPIIVKPRDPPRFPFSSIRKMRLEQEGDLKILLFLL